MRGGRHRKNFDSFELAPEVKLVEVEGRRPQGRRDSLLLQRRLIRTS